MAEMVRGRRGKEPRRFVVLSKEDVPFYDDIEKAKQDARKYADKYNLPYMVAYVRWEAKPE